MEIQTCRRKGYSHLGIVTKVCGEGCGALFIMLLGRVVSECLPRRHRVFARERVVSDIQISDTDSSPHVLFSFYC